MLQTVFMTMQISAQPQMLKMHSMHQSNSLFDNRVVLPGDNGFSIGVLLPVLHAVYRIHRCVGASHVW